MRYLPAIVPCAALLGCTAPLATHEPLDGVWTLESAQSPLDPRTLKLTQHGTTIDGSGDAMGVDAPLRLSVRGSTTGSRVVLTFRFTNGSELVGEYTAAVDSDHLVGVAVFHNGTDLSHSLTYTRN